METSDSQAAGRAGEGAGPGVVRKVELSRMRRVLDVLNFIFRVVMFNK